MPDKLLLQSDGPVARITLNRPAALHALDAEMCARMSAVLLAWRDDPSIAAVILDHKQGTRGFCAGGDLLTVHSAILEGDFAAARRSVLGMMRLNHQIHSFGKPVIAFMDGVTIGAGVGISLPAPFRVASENTSFSMPEGKVGLLADAGAGQYLPRLPGRIGIFLALTSARLDGAECLWSGIATHYLDSEDFEEAKELIANEPDAAEEILRDLSSPAPTARIASNAEAINRLFAADTLEGIVADLSADPSQWAANQLQAVMANCPTAAKVALRIHAGGAAQPDYFSGARQEYALAAHMIERPDFAEGVHAVLVDRNHSPRWQPSRPEDVSDELLDALFAPLPPGEQWTPAS